MMFFQNIRYLTHPEGCPASQAFHDFAGPFDGHAVRCIGCKVLINGLLSFFIERNIFTKVGRQFFKNLFPGIKKITAPGNNLVI